MNEKIKNTCETCNIPLRFGEDFYKGSDNTKFSEDEICDAMILAFPYFQLYARLTKLALDDNPNDEKVQNNYNNFKYNYLADTEYDDAGPKRVETEEDKYIKEHNIDPLFF